MKKLHPLLFQGNLHWQKPYFEGWFFKQVSTDGSSVLAVIPGISLSEEGSFAFIQINDGSHKKSSFYPFPLQSFSVDRGRSLSFRIGENRFSLEGITLNLPEKEDSYGKDPAIQGSLSYKNISPYRGFWPGIMGPYSFVPNMECNHGLGSLNHSVSGSMKVGQKELIFKEGKGYLEKDWGVSFPETYIWIQGNSFEDPSVAVMLSLAKIPWMGGSFPGFLGFIHWGEKTIYLGTYNPSRILSLKAQGESLEILMEKGRYRITLQVEYDKGENLYAPNRGVMDRIIKETVNASITLNLWDRRAKKMLFQGTSRQGGVEILDGAIDIFKR